MLDLDCRKGLEGVHGVLLQVIGHAGEWQALTTRN